MSPLLVSGFLSCALAFHLFTVVSVHYLFPNLPQILVNLMCGQFLCQLAWARGALMLVMPGVWKGVFGQLGAGISGE